MWSIADHYLITGYYLFNKTFILKPAFFSLLAKLSSNQNSVKYSRKRAYSKVGLKKVLVWFAGIVEEILVFQQSLLF